MRLFFADAKDITVMSRLPPMRFEVNDQLIPNVRKNSGMPTVPELRAATLLWFQTHKPEMCIAKLVTTFEAKGWIVLFTPPYCADLQPIELFWAAGKNFARSRYSQGAPLHEVVKNLREGWYGVPGAEGKNIVNCNGMIETAIKKANERVALDEFLSGTVEGGITATEDCDILLGVDAIGRCTRMMCHRAFAATVDDEAPAEPARGDEARGEGARDDDDDDDDENEDVHIDAEV